MRILHPPARPSRRPRGFTLVEMLTVLALVAIVASLAGPSMQAMLVAQRLRAAGTDLVSALLLARSEAIKRNADVTVRPVTGTEWTSGWRVLASNGDQLERKGELGGRVIVTRAPNAIVYNPAGRLAAGGIARVEIADAQGDTAIPTRCVTVDTSGVPKLSATRCP